MLDQPFDNELAINSFYRLFTTSDWMETIAYGNRQTFCFSRLSMKKQEPLSGEEVGHEEDSKLYAELKSYIEGDFKKSNRQPSALSRTSNNKNAVLEIFITEETAQPKQRNKMKMDSK